MIPVNRPTIEPDVGTITARLHEALGAIVARLTEALKWTKPKLVDVAVMRLDVIANRRWRRGAPSNTYKAGVRAAGAS
jgi:hypothetical protein